jgi:hypothetical protein
MTKRFSVTLKDDGTFEVPFDVRAVFGEARPAVKMKLRGKTYATRVMVYGGKPILGIWKAVLASEGLRAGDRLEIALERDDEPRVVEPPKELATALKRNATARAGWAALSFTHQREWAEAIADAKKPDTRTRRVAQAIAAAEQKAERQRPKRGAKRAPNKPAASRSRA